MNVIPLKYAIMIRHTVKNTAIDCSGKNTEKANRGKNGRNRLADLVRVSLPEI